MISKYLSLKPVLCPNPYLIRSTKIIALTILLNGCLHSPKVEEPVAVTEVPVVVMPSAEPIKNSSLKEIVFAQSALKKLGYNIRTVDGLWGPRSAQAMRLFEQQNNFESANGHLSQLNLFHLEKQSGIRVNDIRQPKRTKKKKRRAGLTAQLGPQTNFETGPKLVIANQNYNLYNKPSLKATKSVLIPKGTGLFVISKQNNWYKVESEDKARGYIQAQ